MQRHQDIARPAAVGELTSEGRENVMKLLTSLDPAHKDANGRIRSQIMRSRAGGKRADRRDDTELVEEILPEEEREMKDEPFAANPLKEKDAKKAKKQTGKKSNKRACFWKYCN
ncbi:hypothetical protein chiPu_0014981 [Chiloscyllium punctatum]|uniref:Uncharacterized protein n=2 Tax=Chiloscyllium punctatum TaxID=137246 RepID=A0A401T1K6_CHIPU|nr:hypothetical protein [Chiloscyllium punctatum]